MTDLPALSHRHYTVGWICALPEELTAAMAMLDEAHPRLSQNAQDNNIYTLGRISEHNVVIACLPAGQVGNNAAATIVAQMRYSFEAIRFGLMVGIGGGAPSKEHDIRLGDVVVSKPGKHDGGVIQYDFGRTVTEGRFVRNGSLNAPPPVLLSAISTLQAEHNLHGHRFLQYLSVMDTPRLKSTYTYQGAHNDILFEAEYDHVGESTTCDHCDRSRLELRSVRDSIEPIIHYGTIASGNQVMRHGRTREQWRQESDILCFEMEAAGLMNNFPCLVIRGICDYADSHKNKQWQKYAAGTAAAYAKELLYVIPGNQVLSTRTVNEATGAAEKHNPPRRTASRSLTDKSATVPQIFGPSSYQEYKIFDVPLDTNKNYVERTKLVNQLDGFLKPGDQTTSSSRRAALYGLGGSGKTELAIRFAEKHRNFYSAVFWVNGMDASHLIDGFSGIARLVGTGNEVTSEISVNLAQKWLADHHGWLLIIDNLDEGTALEMLHRKILRAGMNGSILITSRNESIKTIWNSIEVSDMEFEEAVTLLQNIIGPTVSDEPAVTELLEDLGYLPLAVDQAASFISETGITVAQYHKLFATERTRLLKKYPSTQYNVERRENVMTTWEISFNRVQQKHSEAATLLLMLSLLHHQEIPLAILKSCLQGQYYWAPSGEFEEVPSSERWVPESLSATLCTEIGLVEAIAALRKFSFIRHKANSSSVHIHPLVCYWASWRLEKEKALKRLLVICIIGLVGSTLEKQDRIPPQSGRTHGFRGLEEAKLCIWPWRQYPHIASYALRCLQYVKEIRAVPESVAHLALSLLQVLEYSTLVDFPTDQEFAFTVLDNCEALTTTDDVYLQWSALIWRLARSDLCPCRKWIWTSRSERFRTFESGTLCEICQRNFKRFDDFQHQFMSRHGFRTPRTECLANCLGFRSTWDRFWRRYVLERRERSPGDGVAIGHPSSDGGELRGDQTHSGSQTFQDYIRAHSWMENYGFTTRRYLLLRSQCEYHYATGKDRFRDDEVLYTSEEPMEIWGSFKKLCGERSEECRRSAFYASSGLIESNSWKRLEQFLHPLILESIENPVQSWSHERCIIRYIEALLEQGKGEEAKEILSHVKESYEKGGKRLVAAEQSSLIRSAPNEGSQKKDMQIFVKTLSNKTITINTNRWATVRSVTDSIHEKEGLGWGEIRLIYGGKQLETHRFLSDYGIEGGETLHLVLRLSGGSGLYIQ